MTTAAERLRSLSGLAGVSAAVMLLAIGQGATAAQALQNYSGLSSGTASTHLLTDKIVQAIDANPRYSVSINLRSQQLREEDEVLLSILQLFVMEEA